MSNELDYERMFNELFDQHFKRRLNDQHKISYDKGFRDGFQNGMRTKEAKMLESRQYWKEAFMQAARLEFFNLLAKYENDYEQIMKILAKKMNV